MKLKKAYKIITITLATFISLESSITFAEQPKKPVTTASTTSNKPVMADPSLSGLGNSKEPTFIESKNLTLDSEKRVFTYTGGVSVKQGEMTLKADSLQGTYTEANEIQKLEAHGNVDITKGLDMHATSEKAVYDTKNEIMTLTDNPEITQKGSTLSADIVKIFVKENKSVAEGSVRMKVIQTEGEDKAGFKIP